MLEAVLFDWGSTLMDFVWDDALVEEGHRAGLRALGRDDPEELARLSAHFRERYLPLLHAPGTLEEVEYPGLVRELLAHFGIEASDDELNRYLEAEHEAWDPAMQVGVDERRAARGAPEPRTQDRAGLERDRPRAGCSASTSSGRAWRRTSTPSSSPRRSASASRTRRSTRRALSELGVAPERTLFVGDRLVEDVRGPAELGMTTVQAIWFRADENPDGIEPDYQAFTQMDVLNVVERLARRCRLVVRLDLREDAEARRAERAARRTRGSRSRARRPSSRSRSPPRRRTSAAAAGPRGRRRSRRSASASTSRSRSISTSKTFCMQPT